MKKIALLSLALVMILSISVVCAEGFTFGMHVDANPGPSPYYTYEPTDDKDGNAQIHAIAAAVLVDADGKLVDVMIDSIQSKFPFTAKGELGKNFPTTFKTKLELDDDYAMRPASPIGKEWDEQITVLGQYLIGKTAEEIRAIPLEKSAPADEELRAGCTMSVDGYIGAVTTAMDNAIAFDGLTADSKVGLAFSSHGNYSYAATAEKDGFAEAYTHYAGVAMADGKVQAMLLDATRCGLAFNTSGKITSGFDRVLTKKELLEDYAMRPASPIGKEWFEQAAAYEAYMIGKTEADVTATELDDNKAPVNEELRAGCTIDISNALDATVKAIKYAEIY